MWSFPHITSKDWMAGIPSGLSSGQMSLLLLTLLKPATCAFQECFSFSVIFVLFLCFSLPSLLSAISFLSHCPTHTCVLHRSRLWYYARKTIVNSIFSKYEEILRFSTKVYRKIIWPKYIHRDCYKSQQKCPILKSSEREHDCCRPRDNIIASQAIKETIML